MLDGHRLGKTTTTDYFKLTWRAASEKLHVQLPSLVAENFLYELISRLPLTKKWHFDFLQDSSLFQSGLWVHILKLLNGFNSLQLKGS